MSQLKAKHLLDKDQKEEEAMLALREKAKKELEDWYNQHSEQLVKLQKANRSASESSEKEIQSTTTQIRPGTEWERVIKATFSWVFNGNDVLGGQIVRLQPENGEEC